METSKRKSYEKRRFKIITWPCSRRAVGAAVGYLAATDKREQLLEELNGVVGKVKEGFNSALAKYKEGKQEVVQATEEIVAE